MGWLAPRRQWLACLAGPHFSLIFGRVKSEPDFRLIFNVQKMPMEVISRKIKLLLGRRQNIAENQAIELPIAQMVGEIEYDPP